MSTRAAVSKRGFSFANSNAVRICPSLARTSCLTTPFYPDVQISSDDLCEDAFLTGSARRPHEPLLRIWTRWSDKIDNKVVLVVDRIQWSSDEDSSPLYTLEVCWLHHFSWLFDHPASLTWRTATCCRSHWAWL